MKQLFAIVLLSFLLTQNISSQEITEIKNHLNFNIMPLSMVDPTPRFRFGVEYIPKNRIGYSIEVGIGNNFLNKWRLNAPFGHDYSFFEIRPEIKYILKGSDYYYPYLATEFFYINMNDYLESGHYWNGNSNIETTYDAAKFSKQKYGIHFIGGMNLSVWRRLNLDFYGGIGVAKRIITYTDVVNPVESPEQMFVEFPSYYLVEGESVILHLTLGMKIGYRF